MESKDDKRTLTAEQMELLLSNLFGDEPDFDESNEPGFALSLPGTNWSSNLSGKRKAPETLIAEEENQDEKAPSESWEDENEDSSTEEDEEERREPYWVDESEYFFNEEDEEQSELFSEEEEEEIAVADESDSAELREKNGQDTTPHTNGEMSSDAAHVFAKRIVRIVLEEQAAEGSFVPEGSTTSLEFVERLTQKITQEVNQFVRRNESSLSAEDIERPEKRVRHVERSSQPSVIIGSR